MARAEANYAEASANVGAGNAQLAQAAARGSNRALRRFATLVFGALAAALLFLDWLHR